MLNSYSWQFEISHRNKVLQLSTIAREVRLGFRKDSDLNQTLNQPSVNTLLSLNVCRNAGCAIFLKVTAGQCRPACLTNTGNAAALLQHRGHDTVCNYPVSMQSLLMLASTCKS